MALYIEGGDDAFRAILYRDHDQIHEPIVNAAFKTVAPVFTQAAIQFRDTVSDIYKALDIEEASRTIRAAIRKVSSFWGDTGIHYLETMGQFQHANLDMQRYIMAETTVRELYNRQGCDGYSDTYIDKEPGKIGKDHYDYRRVTDSVHVKDEFGMSSITYTEDLREGDRKLDILEQADICASWNRVKAMILKRGEDPTSKYNSML